MEKAIETLDKTIENRKKQKFQNYYQGRLQLIEKVRERRQTEDSLSDNEQIMIGG